MSSPLRVFTGQPVVIDSSVAFKWFDASEPGADDAGELLALHAGGQVALVSSALMPVEVADALLCRGAATADVQAAIGFLDQADILTAPLDPDLLAAAVALAEADGTALYDAVFVALAAALDAELVTADRRQAATSGCRTRLIG